MNYLSLTLSFNKLSLYCNRCYPKHFLPFQVRNMQEAIAVKHLKLDVNKSGALHEDSNSLEKFKELMDDLDNLSSEIKNLHKS